MDKPCNFNISCKDVKIKYPEPPPDERLPICPGKAQKNLDVNLSTENEISNENNLVTKNKKFIPPHEEPKESPVICPCMLPIPEYEPPAELIPIRLETATAIPENPLYCPAFYKHPCPAVTGTGICPAHGSPRVGDICPSSNLEILKDGKLLSKLSTQINKIDGRTITCNEEKDICPDEQIKKEEKKKMDYFFQVPDELKASYNEYYRNANLPARPDHPEWFSGYRCQWPSSQLWNYQTSQMIYGWFPPNIYTISHIFKPKTNSFSTLYGRSRSISNQSLNL